MGFKTKSFYKFMSFFCTGSALFLMPLETVFAQDANDMRAFMMSAYQSDPELMAARQEYESAKELYPQARAGYRPNVRAEAYLFSTNIDNSNFGNSDGATTKDMTLSVEQPLWRGGRTSAEVERAHSFIRAAELTLNRTEQEVLLEVAQIYLDVMRERSLLALRQRNADILAREYNAAQERFDLGDITITDVHQAKTRNARAQAALVRAQSEHDIRMAEFSEVTGRSAPQMLENPSTIVLDIPQKLAEMIALAEYNNLDLMIAQSEKDAAEHNVDVVFSERLPEITAFASINKQYDPQPGLIDHSRTDTIGVRANVALYQGGSVMSRIRQARADLKRNEYTLEDIQRDIRKDVISNYKSYVAAKEQIAARELEVAAANQALDGVREEARSGQRKLLDILDADQEVIEAEIALVSARRDSVLAWYALAATLGLFNADQIGLFETGSITQTASQ